MLDPENPSHGLCPRKDKKLCGSQIAPQPPRIHKGRRKGRNQSYLAKWQWSRIMSLGGEVFKEVGGNRGHSILQCLALQTIYLALPTVVHAPSGIVDKKLNVCTEGHGVKRTF